MSPRFVGFYREVLPEGGGVLNLKTDSRELYGYVRETAPIEQWGVLEDVEDVYAQSSNPLLTEVQT